MIIELKNQIINSDNNIWDLIEDKTTFKYVLENMKKYIINKVSFNKSDRNIIINDSNLIIKAGNYVATFKKEDFPLNEKVLVLKMFIQELKNRTKKEFLKNQIDQFFKNAV